MWLNTGKIYKDLPPGVDTVHNYYERLVLEEISRKFDEAQYSGDFLADVACVALNQLPPRYVRYDVDMTFFLSPVEMKEIHDKVSNAVDAAADYVESRGPRHPEEQNGVS